MDGRSKINFGTTKTFFIKHTGTTPLTSISISKKGNHRKDFIVTSSGKTGLTSGFTASFKVKFQPTAKELRDERDDFRN